MPKKLWVLADAARGVAVDELSITPDQVGGRDSFFVKKRRLQSGLSQGVDTVEISTGPFRFVVLPTRGMGIWKAWHGDTEIGWRSPVRGPVHPAFVPLMEPGGLGWLDGFDELVVRCGLESNGAPDFDEQGRLKYPLHGRIANRPAHHLELSVDPDAGEIHLTGIVDETRFHFSKLRLKSTVLANIGRAGFRLVDEVTNLSGKPAEMQLLYHVNIGPPVLEPGSKAIAPARTVAPRDKTAAVAAQTWDTFGPALTDFAEQVYFFDLAGDDDQRTRVLLTNARGDRGASLAFSKAQLPYFILWKNTSTEADGYLTGIEPATNFPNRRTFEGEQGRTVRLGPGESKTFELALEFHPDAASVASAEEHIQKLQGTHQPVVLDHPKSGWSPA